jgi:hypothetical protein
VIRVLDQFGLDAPTDVPQWDGLTNARRDHDFVPALDCHRPTTPDPRGAP